MRDTILAVALSIAFGAQAEAPVFLPAPGLRVTVGPGSETILLADIDNDGWMDMLTRHLLTRRIAVLLGRRRGVGKRWAGEVLSGFGLGDAP